MPHVPEKERAEDERMQHMSNAVLQAAQLWWRRVWHAPRVGTNARVISEWAGAEYDYCRGSEDCSDALTWNAIINVSQIKSIFAAIAVFS